MKVRVALSFGALLWGVAASAQSQAYVYFAPGAVGSAVENWTDANFAMALGGGGKFVSKVGLGAGSDHGYVGPREGFRANGAGLFSINGCYDIKRGGKVVPFVTGGYSRLFASAPGSNLGNAGAGLNYWFGRRTGVLLEFRDHIQKETGFTGQIMVLRVGLAIR